MQVKLDRELLKNDYTVEFLEIELTKEEKLDFENAVLRFDFPTVNFGGSFTEKVTTSTTKDVTDPDTGDVTTETITETKDVEVFKFSDNVRKLPEGLPLKRIFKSGQYGDNAEKYANLYANLIEQRINDAFDELKSKSDNFSTNDKDIFY